MWLRLCSFAQEQRRIFVAASTHLSPWFGTVLADISAASAETLALQPSLTPAICAQVVGCQEHTSAFRSRVQEAHADPLHDSSTITSNVDKDTVIATATHSCSFTVGARENKPRILTIHPILTPGIGAIILEYRA